MSRRKRAEKRKLIPDAEYKNLVVAKFINCVMKDGKKSIAESIVYGALKRLSSSTKKTAMESFEQAVSNVKPTVEVRSRRIGGATYQVPVEIRDARSLALAIRWIIGASASRGERTMQDRVASELIDAHNDKGSSVKKRDDTHKMAESNRAFGHYKF